MAILLSGPLLWLSCHKAPSPLPPETAAVDPLPNVNPDASHTVPRRSAPIIVTNPVSLSANQEVSEKTNTPPTIRCGPMQSFSCTPADGLQATVAVHVEDADGDPLSVVWSIDGRDRYTQQVSTNGPPTSADLTYAYTFTPGDHVVKVTVSDGELNTFCSTEVTIQKDTQEPVIVCPADVAVMTDPGRCTALITFAPKATDNCPDLTVVCEPPSGTAFPIGATTVRCTATDTAGNVSSCYFEVLVRFTNRCPQTDAYWRQNPGAWPISSLNLGSQTYTKSQLMGLLHGTAPQDASMVLARQLITAGLNTALGSDPRPVCGQLTEAHDLLSQFSGKLPFHVNLAVPAARPMMRLATVLGSYNAGMLTPNCVP